MERHWKVTCDNCDTILEAGIDSPYVGEEREQLGCPSCSALARTLQVEPWPDDEEDEADVGAVPKVGDGPWPDHVPAIAARTLDEETPSDPEDGAAEITLEYREHPVFEHLLASRPELSAPSPDPRVSEHRPALGRTYQDFVQQSLTTAAPGTRWRAWRNDGTGGKGPAGDIVTLLQTWNDLAPTLALYADLSVLLAMAIQWLAKFTRSEVHINAAAASLLAAKAIAEAGGDRDLIPAFTVGMRGLPEFGWSDDDGFLVGFRGELTLWTVVVGLTGNIVHVHEAEVSGRLPAWWRDDAQWQAAHAEEWGRPAHDPADDLAGDGEISDTDDLRGGA